jgi:glycogen debranching enzyme
MALAPQPSPQTLSPRPPPAHHQGDQPSRDLHLEALTITDVTADLSLLESDEGWPYASSLPVAAEDPGRFHALFGRDSLITSLQLLPARPQMARATLRALAARQGRDENPGTQEEAGKIGHEFRTSPPQSFIDGGWPDPGSFCYYGAADATSWFCVVLAATHDKRLAHELESAWRSAADWIARTLDFGGGLLRHGPGSFPGGLSQQGWRDTIDPTGAKGGGMLRADGTGPRPPLADLDTQAVTVAALRGLAALSGEDVWRERAAALRTRLSHEFDPDVVALEAGDRIVPGAGSQLGWLLWADALEPAAARAAADRLCEADILTDAGLRTLAATAMCFDPHAYHRGSIWPFDSWLGWGGLRAAGRDAEAERARSGVLSAVHRLGHAHELYALTPQGRLEPVAAANRVQAWTVGACWALEHRWDGRGRAAPARRDP